jgi:hypothetical protein
VYWRVPGLPRTVNVHPGPPPPPTLDVPADGRSVGRPQIGRIENAVQLPEREWYTRGEPDPGSPPPLGFRTVREVE